MAEPALVWHDSLRMNRNCIIDTRCIWKTSGIDIIFNQTESPELSKIDSVITDDWAKDIRDVNATKYTVRTVSLVDLLIEHQAPHDIDYISVYTEGS